MDLTLCSQVETVVPEEYSAAIFREFFVVGCFLLVTCLAYLSAFGMICSLNWLNFYRTTRLYMT
jgi:hypothetical protein